MPATPFNGTPTTPNKSFDSSSDHKTPHLGSLNMGGMTNLTALAGTTGVDCSLIHGDEWNQMEGNLTENILKNHTATISINETYTVKTNLVNRVNGTTNDTRIGVHNQTNIAPRNDEFLHTRTEIHHQPEHRIQLTEDHDIAAKVIDYVEEHISRELFKLSLTGPEIAINPIFAFEYKSIASSFKGIAAESAFLECELKELKTAIQLVASEVVAVKAKAAVSHLKVIGANLNAGFAGNGDSPLG